jgi:hypothetical protein
VLDRLTPHDLNFAHLAGGVVFGPFPVPGLEAVRQVLRNLADRAPHLPVFCRLSRSARGGRWAPIEAAERDDWCASMVHPASELQGPPDRWITHLLRPPRSEQMLRIWLGRTHTAIWVSHLLGDNEFTGFVPSVLHAAAGGPPPVASPPEAARAPLTRAALSHFGRDPRRLVAAYRESRAGGAEPEQRRVDEPIAFDAQARTASREAMDRLAAWRDERAPGTSLGSVLAVGVRRALERAGLEFAGPGTRMLVDGRRYLPPTAVVPGNFTTSILLAPDEPGSTRAWDDALRRNLDSGRPLLTMASSAVKARVRGEPPLRAAVSGPRLPTLSISNLGRLRGYEQLPGLDLDRAACLCANPPEPFGLTCFLTGLAGRTTFTVSFSPQVIDPAVVGAGLDLLAADPVAVVAADP